MRSRKPIHHAVRVISLAGLSILLLSAGMCRQAEEPLADSGDTAVASGLEEDARAEEQALAARAEAEAVEQQRLAEIAAAERALAEREAELAAAEERLRQERAVAAERERLAAEQAAVARRERELAVRERELRERQAEVTEREEELRGVEAEPLGAVEPAAEPGEYDGSFDEPWRDGPAEPAEVVGVEAPAAVPAPAREPERPAVTVSLPPGEVLEVQIAKTLSSGSNRVGEVFSAFLVHDVFDSRGDLVIPAGAEVRGRVVEAEPYRRGGGPATLGVEFTHLVVPPDQTVGIHATFAELGADKRKNRKKVIAGAVAGAILGHVLGGDGSKNVLVGAAVGAAAGGAVVASARDKDAEIPAGQIIPLRLEEVVTVEIEYGAPAGP